MRLFVAIEMPAAVRREIASRVAAAARELPPARWVGAEALHVTLAFLGEAPAESVEPLARALAAATPALAPFTLRVAGAGAFPPHGGARVLWLGLEPAAPLERLAATVRDAVSACGLPFDAKPFRAHLTVARCRAPWRERDRARALAALGTESGPELRVEGVALIESRLSPEGPRYRALATAGLGDAP